MGWYDRIMPTVKELEPIVEEGAANIVKLPGVISVHASGSYATQINIPSAPIRDVELIIKCSFDSGDLLAIEKGPMGPFNIPSNELEEEGFNPRAVAFTKKLLKCCNFKTDFWCFSKDERFLHWGPVAETVEEWRQVRQEAEKKAESQTGFCRNKLKKADTEDAKEWINTYESALRTFINHGPLGWYESSYGESSSVFDEAIKLA